MLYYSKFICVLLFFIVATFASCNVFDPRADVPAYLSIQPFEVSTDSLTQGTNQQKITDAWVYVNDNLQGTYELPAKVPIIANGNYTLKIYPGIKVNGIAANRSVYTFLNYYEEKNFSLKPGVLSYVSGKTTYKSNLTFIWLENFESQGVTLVKGANSDTTFFVVQGGTESFNNSRFGKLVLDGVKTQFQLNSFQGFKLPNKGTQSIILEMHYNISTDMSVGLIANQPGNTTVNPLLTLVSTHGNWKKIYVNFTDLAATFNQAESYTVYFSGRRASDAASATFCLDNLKLIYE